METKTCENCTIGLLHHSESSELVTLDGLKTHITENIEFNKAIDADSLLRTIPHIFRKIWTLHDYADFRKNTNLTRFRHCPFCGKEVNWKKIKEE